MKVIICKDNIEQLRPLAEQWFSECNASAFGLVADVDAHLADMWNFVGLLDRDLLLLMDDNEQVVGYMGLTFFKSPISEQIIANEHNFFISSEYRGGTSALKLLKAAQEWAKEKKCSHLILNASLLASSLYERVCKLYEKMGMREFETSYIAEV